MHSFQPSRGRIFFEVLCAVGIAASCGGAWMQTGASALLAAAAVATLYGLVRFFDLFRGQSSVAVEPQRIEVERGPAVDVPVRQNVSAQLTEIEERLTAYQAVQDAPAVEPPLPEETQPVEPIAGKSRAKAPRKAASRRTGSPKKKAAALAREEEAVDLAFPDVHADGDPAANEPPTAEEPFHPPVAPLFEPEPFVRQQQRAMFGRKAG